MYFFFIVMLVLASLLGYASQSHKVYEIQPEAPYGGLTVEVDWHRPNSVCSFSNDSIQDGGCFTYRFMRDAMPIEVYYVEPDSLFIIDDYITGYKSNGFNVYSVREVYEPSNERENYTVDCEDETYAIAKVGETYIKTYPIYYIVDSENDTCKVKRPSFIHNFTYRIIVYADIVTAWDSDGNLVLGD